MIATQYVKTFDRIIQQAIKHQILDELDLGVSGLSVDSYLIFYRSIVEGIEILKVVSGYQNLEASFKDCDSQP